MNINKYIEWWNVWDEIDTQSSKDCLTNTQFIEIIEQFEKDDDIELMVDECYLDGENLVFCFGEEGGKNESDNQGWSRDYTFIVNSDFLIVSAEYSQG